MARWYLHPVGDGTFYPVYQDDSGNYHKLSEQPLTQGEAEATAANHERSSGGGGSQPSSGGSQPSSSGKAYDTPNGPKTIADMRDELRRAGGPVDSWSDQQIYDNYIQTSSAGAGGGAGGPGTVGGTIAGGDTNGAEDAAWRIAQMQSDRQKTSGWMTDPEEAALDYIWEMGNREGGDTFQNFKQFFEERGWDVSTPQGQRDAVKRWLVFAQNGKNAQDVAKGWGWDHKATPTLDRETSWAQIMSSLSGPRDWIKYARMLQGMPEGSMGDQEKYFQRTSPWGAVSPTPSWGDAMGDMYGTPTGKQPMNYDNILRAQPMPFPEPQVDYPMPTGGGDPGHDTFWNAMRSSSDYGINPPRVEDYGGRTHMEEPFGPTYGINPPMQDGVYGGGTYAEEPFGPSGQQSSQFAAGGDSPYSWQPAGPGRDAYANGVLQPHKINIKDFNNWDPSTREMQSGVWEDQGVHADDMWSRMRKAAPKGYAASTSTWR